MVYSCDLSWLRNRVDMYCFCAQFLGYMRRAILARHLRGWYVAWYCVLHVTMVSEKRTRVQIVALHRHGTASWCIWRFTSIWHLEDGQCWELDALEDDLRKKSLHIVMHYVS